MQLSIFLQMELKFLIRSARTRKILIALILSPVLWYYILWTGPFKWEFEAYVYLFFMVSIGSVSYSQYFYSWHASFLAGYAILPVNWYAYLSARVLLIMLMTLYGAITAVVLFWNTPYWTVTSAVIVYLLPVIPLVLLHSGTEGVTKIDPDRRGIFSNYIGKNIRHLLMELLVFGIPLLLLLIENVFSISGATNLYLWVVGVCAFAWLPFAIHGRSSNKTWLYTITSLN